MFRRIPLWIAAVALAFSAVLQAADTLRIVPLVQDGSVLVSFQLENGFTDDVRAAVASGLKTTFTYTVDLRLEVPLWVDRTLGSAIVTSSVQYDNLTRRYTLSRLLDGRMEESRVTDDESIVRQLMTGFERLPLFKTSALEPNREYYVRIRAQIRPQSDGYVWPWSSRSGQKKFTFIS